MGKPKPSKYRLSHKAGKPPGSLIYTGVHKANATEVNLVQYNADTITRQEVKDLKEAFYQIDNNFITWLNINALSNTDIIKKLGELFRFHSLLLEDILNVQQLPKAEHFDNYVYCAIKMISLNPFDTSIDEEYISFILGEHYLISFQEKEGDVFNPVRIRLNETNSKIRNRGSSYLLYALIDVIVDNYFLIIEHLGDKAAELEEHLLQGDNVVTIKDIIALKKKNLIVKKAIFPMRDSLGILYVSESKFIPDSEKLYFSDVRDHIEHINNELDTMRETVSSLMDLHHSNQNTRMNEVMKTLTIIGAIFIPLTFIAGVYGMNFENIPELKYEFSYYIVLLLMAVIGIAMFGFMKHKRYF